MSFLGLPATGVCGAAGCRGGMQTRREVWSGHACSTPAMRAEQSSHGPRRAPCCAGTNRWRLSATRSAIGEALRFRTPYTTIARRRLRSKGRLGTYQNTDTPPIDVRTAHTHALSPSPLTRSLPAHSPRSLAGAMRTSTFAIIVAVAAVCLLLLPRTARAETCGECMMEFQVGLGN